MPNTHLRTETSGHDAPADATEPIRQSPAYGTVCRHCGQVHPGGRFVVGCPNARLQGALYSRLVQRGALPEQAEAVAALALSQREIEADLGGAESLSRVHRDAIRDLLRLELVSEFLFDRLLEAGPLTGKGRTRAATMTYLQVLDRVHRLRQMVGLARVPRPVLSLAEALAAVRLPEDDDAA